MWSTFGIICEPTTDTPHKVDIAAMQEEHSKQSASCQHKASSGGSNVQQTCPKTCLIKRQELNSVSSGQGQQSDQLKSRLSVQRNKYMACKWKQFLDNVPPNYVTINLYSEVHRTCVMPRRKTLTGQFFGVDYKLAPIPVSTGLKN